MARSKAAPVPVRASSSSWPSRASGKSEGVRPPASGDRQCATRAASASTYPAASRPAVAGERRERSNAQLTRSSPPSTMALTSTAWRGRWRGLWSGPADSGASSQRPAPPSAASSWPR